MTPYKTKPIRDVTTILIDYRGKTPAKAKSGVKLITAKVIKDGFIVDGNHEYIATDGYDAWMRRGLPCQWDILITTEAPLGEVAQLRTPEKVALAQRIILLRGDPSVINQSYFFHALKSPFVQAGLRARSTGTTVLGIKQSELWQVELPCPPLPTQERISSILSAYDDLIENNTRRIQILEQMSQMIYKEWFVNFQFPGHEGVKKIDSPMGPIPEGWEIVRTGDRFTTVLGGTPSRSRPDFWEGGTIPWINSGKVNELRVIDASELISPEGLRHSSTKLMPKRTTVLAITGATLGQVSLLEIEASANQSVVGIYDDRGHYSEYVYLTYRTIIDAVIKHASGGAQQHINKEVVNDVKIILPPRPVIDWFNGLVRPLFDAVANLLLKNVNLRNTRDLLLPKLISGEVSVEQFEAEAVAQGV